jgi:TolB protein
MFIINVDGSGLQPIPTVPGGDFDPVWSPDGTQIAFTSLRDNGRSKILIYNLQENLVASLSDVYSRAKQPAWSPDGKEIIFISERRGAPQIWSMNSDGSNQQLFSKSPGYLNSHPTWSPDGEVILFTQLIASGGIPRLAVAPYQFEDYEEYPFTQDQTPMREARYSPDGFWIAFEGWLPDSNQNIFIIASNGASREQVTSDPAVDFDPAWNFSQ